MHEGEAEVYWVSYMEGEQRVLLFTQHENVYLKSKSIIDSEASKREIFLSIAAIGISVVSDKRFSILLIVPDQSKIKLISFVGCTGIQSS